MMVIMTDLLQAGDGDPRARVFISYSRKDMVFADQLEAALKARGFEPLIDRTEIYAFEDWWKRIETLIGHADTVVFVLSPNAVKSDVALKEVVHAASLSKRFAPIVFRRVEDNAVPEPLRRLNFIFFDDPVRFEESADRLAEALQTDIGWIRRHTEFGEAAGRWAAAGRPVGLMLRSPVLEEAEYWITYRPHGAPLPTAETQAFVAESRNAEIERQKAEAIAKTWRRRAQAAIYVLLVGIICGLIGWINQDYIKAQWRWYTTERPFAAANIWPHVLSAAAEHGLKPRDSFRECADAQGKDYCPIMVVVPAGSFLMGSPPSEKGRSANEGPQHQVTIAKAFAVSKFELTFDEWDTCAAYGNCELVDGAGRGRGQQPAFNVSWFDAKRYVAWLSATTGKNYRLLTEAEYEYATRAGTQTAYPWGDDIGENNANCDGCGSQYRVTAPVGSFAPNGFGLYDMVGNVMQWVEDCYHPSYEVQTPQGKSDAPTDGLAWTSSSCDAAITRSGSWRQGPVRIRSANRLGRGAEEKGGETGFRVARTLVP
jgi:formylglycine-generating enzyme required for sulfatase activity